MRHLEGGSRLRRNTRRAPAASAGSSFGRGRRQHPLGDQQGEFVSLVARRVFELQANDLGADVSCQMLGFFRCGEEGFLLYVFSGAGFGVISVLISDGVLSSLDCT